MPRDVLVFIPTYNERDNAPTMYERLVKMGLDADVLFLDDDSPDGTGEVLDEIAKSDPGLTVLHRKGKRGIGSAHREGLRYAYEKGYRILITLDCDFSHEPERLPGFLEKKDQADLVIGSRHLPEEGLAGWPLHRKALCKAGHYVTTLALGLPCDATTSFRLYRLDRIPREIFEKVESQGYSFFFESAYIMKLNGVRMLEIPVAFPARAAGESKMGTSDAVASLARLLKLVNPLKKRQKLLPVGRKAA